MARKSLAMGIVSALLAVSAIAWAEEANTIFGEWTLKGKGIVGGHLSVMEKKGQVVTVDLHSDQKLYLGEGNLNKKGTRIKGWVELFDQQPRGGEPEVYDIIVKYKKKKDKVQGKCEVFKSRRNKRGKYTGTRAF